MKRYYKHSSLGLALMILSKKKRNSLVLGLALVQAPVQGSITVGIIAGIASGIALFGSGLWWYNSSVDKAQRQLIDDSIVLYSKYKKLYITELRGFDAQQDISLIAASMPQCAFNQYVAELSKNRATIQAALVSLSAIICSKKMGHALSEQAQVQIECLSALGNQLESFACYLDSHYGYFDLYKKYQVLAWQYEKEVETVKRYSHNDPDRAVKQLKQILLSSCSDSSITYPFVSYSNGVHDDLRVLDNALEVFIKTEGQQTDGSAGTLYKNGIALRSALDTVRNILAQTSEYQAQRDLYQQAVRAQALVEAEQRKALAEEQKNLIELQKLEELRRANVLQQQAIYEQQRQVRALREAQKMLNQTLNASSNPDIKQELQKIQQKLNSLN